MQTWGGIMSVEKVFWEDPYISTISAKVTGVNENVLTVNKTIFYAFSGGQASDEGTINNYKILKAEKVGQEIYYTIEGPHELKVGDDVNIVIDWEKRYRIMRLHFAAEIILEIVNQLLGRPEKIGANITDAKARIDFVCEDNISKAFGLLLDEVNRIIKANYPIISDFSNREKELRYWEVKGFGKVNCGGTHLRTTGEVGQIKLKRDNIGKNKERIEIVLLN
jgi:Ser-tRNA(Ala) deacylase AlaX